MNNGERVTLREVYDILNRLEDKMDKRLSSVEGRSDDLDRRLAHMEGKASVAGSVAGAVAGLVTGLLSEFIRRQM